jgi:hypothetical protein
MRRALGLVVLGIALGATLEAHVDLQIPREAAPAEAGVQRRQPGPRWAAAVYCRTHQRFLSVSGEPAAHRSPAAEKLMSAIYGLFLYAPAEGFPVQVLARGLRSEDGQTLEGDLIVEAVHPAVAQGPELWNAVQAVRRQGIRRIRGRVLFVPEQSPERPAALPELEERLRLSGVQIDPAPAQGVPAQGPEIRLGSWESRPLFTLLRRDVGILLPLLPEPASLRSTLQNLDPLGTDWIPDSYPELRAVDVIDLLHKGLAHNQVGSELDASLQMLDLGSDGAPAVRGVVAHGEKSSEMLGIARLPGHGDALVDLWTAEDVSAQQLGALLLESLRDKIDEAGQILARQELPEPHSSSD